MGLTPPPLPCASHTLINIDATQTLQTTAEILIARATLSGTTLAKGLTDGICQLLDVSTQTRVIISNDVDPSLGRNIY